MGYVKKFKFLLKFSLTIKTTYWYYQFRLKI